MSLIVRWRVPVAASLLAALSMLAPKAGAHESAEHRHTLSKDVKVSLVDYKVPDLTLVRDDGTRVKLPRELDDGRPVVMNFVYTTCPGICPIMSAMFSEFQDRLGAERSRVHMVSISIDPEQDTPARLREYATKFSAGPQWQHYTGTVADSIAVQKAFGVYRGDKMSHDPLTLMRSEPGKPWVRIDGFATAVDLVSQYVSLASLCDSKTSAAPE